MSLDLVRDLVQHINLLQVCLTLSHPVEDPGHPPSTLPTGGALSTTLVLVKVHQPGNTQNDISLFVHHDQSSCSQSSFGFYKSIEICQHGRTDGLRDDGGGAASGNDS